MRVFFIVLIFIPFLSFSQTRYLDNVFTNINVSSDVIYGQNVTGGCTDSLANNYDSLATVDDGSCLYYLSINEAEYFWDVDPGVGSAIPLLALDGNFNQVIEQLFLNDENLPSSGHHSFNIRVKDSDGNYGQVFTQIINIEDNLTNLGVFVLEAEYFWDVDPGVGSAIPLLA